MASTEASEQPQEVMAYIRDVVKKILRKKYPYLPDNALDQLLDRISNLEKCLEDLFPHMEASKARISIFSLPAELRNRIYEFVLIQNNYRVCLQHRGEEPVTGPYLPTWATWASPFGLLMAFKQIRAEALPIYYENTFTVQSAEISRAKNVLNPWLDTVGQRRASKIHGIRLLDLGYDGSREDRLRRTNAQATYSKHRVYYELGLEELGVSMEQFSLQYLHFPSFQQFELLADGSSRAVAKDTLG